MKMWNMTILIGNVLHTQFLFVWGIDSRSRVVTNLLISVIFLSYVFNFKNNMWHLRIWVHHFFSFLHVIIKFKKQLKEPDTWLRLRDEPGPLLTFFSHYERQFILRWDSCYKDHRRKTDFLNKPWKRTLQVCSSWCRMSTYLYKSLSEKKGWELISFMIVKAPKVPCTYTYIRYFDHDSVVTCASM